jgi:small GTP-binding protein
MQKKICLLGDASVGKTSLIRQFVENKFDDNYLTTIGVKISQKTLAFNEDRLKMLIWDLAGEDRFHHMDNSYLQGASGAIIVCDITRGETLNCLDHYAQKVRQINPQAALLFAANKVDLTENIFISEADMAGIAQGHDADYFMTSAKTGQNVEAAFRILGKLMRRAI